MTNLSLEQSIKNFIQFELNLNIEENNKTILTKNQELDILIPNKNIAIEIDGIFWHSNKFKNKNYHLNKTIECEKKGIKLIHIFEDEWTFKEEIVKFKLKELLNVNSSESINKNNIQIKETSNSKKNNFLKKYNIQGKDHSIIKIGSFLDDKLISIMTFSIVSKKENIWELKNYCSHFNYSIENDKIDLLNYFKNKFHWNKIICFIDRRWPEENEYQQIGFILDSIIKPNFWFVKKGIKKRNYRYVEKEKNQKKFGNEKIKIYKIWDCGCLKLKMENK